MSDDALDIEELTRKAKVLAEATGRAEDDVLADLLDDGKLNMSNRSGRDLVAELREAAELMDAVKEINRDVSQNTVLNGGDNKTEVKVESTIEGDLVDRAIASVERKAEAMKRIATIIVPVILLFGGGGSLEAMGVIDIFGSDPEDDGSIEVDTYGCTAIDAANYNPEANIDDGSCWWDEPEPEWCGEVQATRSPELSTRHNDGHALTIHWWLKHDLQGDDCEVDVEFMFSFYHEGAYAGTIEYNQNPRAGIPDHEKYLFFEPPALENLGEGNWSIEARWKYADGPEDGCCEMTNTVWIGEPQDDDGSQTCEPYFYSVQATREVDAGNETEIIGEFDVDWGGQNCDTYEAEITVEMEPHTCDDTREWIAYETLTYLTKGQDGDIEEIVWDMTATESYWSCVDVLFRITIDGNDYETRWVEGV